MDQINQYTLRNSLTQLINNKVSNLTDNNSDQFTSAIITVLAVSFGSILVGFLTNINRYISPNYILSKLHYYLTYLWNDYITHEISYSITMQNGFAFNDASLQNNDNDTYITAILWFLNREGVYLKEKNNFLKTQLMKSGDKLGKVDNNNYNTQAYYDDDPYYMPQRKRKNKDEKPETKSDEFEAVCISSKPVYYNDIEIWMHEEKKNISSNNSTSSNNGRGGGNSASTIKEITVYLKVKRKEYYKIKEFLTKCYDKYLEKINSCQTKYIYKTMRPTHEDIARINRGSRRSTKKIERYEFKSTRTFDSVFFKNKEKIFEYIKDVHIRNKYNKTYTGILLQGEAGTGKTSFIKALINTLHSNCAMLNFKDINTGQELFDIFHKNKLGSFMVNKKNMVYVFEDIDCQDEFVELKRTKNDKKTYNLDINDILIKVDKELSEDNMFVAPSVKRAIKDSLGGSTKHRITLSDILNAMDGLVELKDCIIIMTTNHPEKLDDALKRPGRIDLNIKLDKYDHNLIAQHLSYHYKTSVSLEDVKNIEVNKFTGAKIESICFKNKNLKNTINNLTSSENIQDSELEEKKQEEEKQELEEKDVIINDRPNKVLRCANGHMAELEECSEVSPFGISSNDF